MNEKEGSKMMGVLVEHQEEFSGLTSEEAQWVNRNPKQAIALFIESVRNKYKDCFRVNTQIIRRISGSDPLFIPALQGKCWLDEAKDFFFNTDPDFYKLESGVMATPAKQVSVYSFLATCSLKDIVSSLVPDLPELLLTPLQITRFAKDHPAWFDCPGVIFYFMSGRKIFAAGIKKVEKGFSILLFDKNEVWPAGYRMVAAY